uniref:SJCHGC09541 protein n=1 Tax=Schistosoma japonicum TaxID=6182 RepID=Q5DG88_SCHJA|nr:SJCHGC09541 protein [Schistosoma japonicum]
MVLFGLMNKAIFVWTVCSTFLFLLVLKLNEILYWNWFIIFIPMWLVDVILFTASILYMSRKFTHILGEHDAGSRFIQTLSLGFILCKLISQIVLCLSLEGHLDTLLNSFYQLFFVDKASNINKADNSTIVKYRMVYAVFPLWTTLVLCLIIVCAQILTTRSTAIWSFCSNKEPSDNHHERRKQGKTNILSGVELK